LRETALRLIEADLPSTTRRKSIVFPTEMEICMMIRKCLVFTLTAGLLLGIGVLAGASLSKAADDETPLGKIMEKVNKHDGAIKRGTRNKVAFAKSQKDVEKSAKELVKLAKEAKNLKDAAKKAKDVANPEKKWDEYIDELVKTSEEFGKVAGKAGATFQDAKDSYVNVKKVCTNCHKDFRVDDTKF
jgi:cytochrome c556